MSPRVTALALLAVLLLAGLLPYWGVLHWLPWSGDALKWIARGSTDVRSWWQWDFASKHFVGYRPVTALSFTLDELVGGYTPEVYRATDLAFHLLSGAAIFALYREVTGDRSVLGLLPVLLVFAHPTTEDIVPESARRSYLLAATFGCAGGVVLCRYGTRSWGGVVGAALIGLGALSNELGFVLIPLVPWFLSRSTLDRRAIAVASVPSAFVLAAAVLARYLALGTLGGYQRRLFAFVNNHVLMWHENKSWEPDTILAAAWSHSVDPIGVNGASQLFSGWAETAFGILTACWIGWIGVVRPLLHRREPRSRVALGLSAWVAGSLAIVVLSQTWFWRQAYAVVIPLGMLIAYELGPAIEGALARRWRALPTVALSAALLAAVAWNGPLLAGGFHRSPYANVIVGTPLARKIVRLLEPVPDGAEVYLAAPLRATGGHLLRIWGEVLARPRRVTFHLLGHLTSTAVPEAATVAIRKGEMGPRLALGGGMVIAVAKNLPASPLDGNSLDVARLWRDDREVWLLALDTNDAYAVRAQEPPEGVEPIQLPLVDDRAQPLPGETDPDYSSGAGPIDDVEPPEGE